MTMIKLAAGITEIEGKGPGGIWRYDQCGQHLQTYPREIEHGPSEKQRARQNAFSVLRSYVQTHGTFYFVAAWSNYAMQHPKKTSKGKIYYSTWYNTFLGFNINNVVNGLPIQPLPPGYPPEPPPE
jgi:hypothetical protein